MRPRLVLIAVLLLLAAGAALAAAWMMREDPPPPVVRGSPTVEFDTTEEPAAATQETTTAPAAEPLKEPWPTYGYDVARTHVAPYPHRPPYHRLWRFGARALIEFPPTIAYGRMYVSQAKAHLFAVDTETGEIVWRRHFRNSCSAASPTVSGGLVYQPYLPRDCRDRGKPGFLVAVDAETGKEVWRFEGPASESSALVVDRTVYLGTWDHHLYALNARTGRLRWRYQADDELNSAPAYAHGTVYVGSDGGRLHAVYARTGRLRWRAEALRREYFYATPTLAYGRVFIGNTDGTVYAFGAKTGNLLWTQRAGTYVYTAAAVWNRMVFVGSYDGNFYALDAATGDVRWRHDSPGSIHGAPTVMNGLVYFATCGTCGQHGSRYAELGPRRTYALRARTGRIVWRFPEGHYSPIVADEKRVYLADTGAVFALEPCGRGKLPRC
jgi:outer membrane protein assembly factor BamB